MKKILISIFLLTSVFGCVKQPKEGKLILKVDNYVLTQDEFEEGFMQSPYATRNTPESRKYYLDNLVNQKLILSDAQAQGLDKEKNFLKMVEKFWEQSLLKAALDKKAEEFSGSIRVSEESIKETYDKLRREGKTDKSLQEYHDQLKWELARAIEAQAFNDWLIQLRKKAQIKINYDLLKRE